MIFFLILNFVTVETWEAALYHHPESAISSSELSQPSQHGEVGMDPLVDGEASTQEATPLGGSDSEPCLFTFHSATLELFSLIIDITTIERGQFGGIFSGKANSLLPLVPHHIPARVTFEVNYLSPSRLCCKIICWNSFPGFPVSENCVHISPTYFQRKWIYILKPKSFFKTPFRGICWLGLCSPVL